MAIIKTFGVDKDSIKVRWEEPYVSSAVNQVMSAFPRGVYRGFSVQELDTPGSGVQIVMDATRGDSLALFEDLDTGYKLAVRILADFDLLFSFTVSTDYYIWIDVDYAESTDTQGYVRVGELADLTAATNAVPIAKFNSNNAIILNAEITQNRTLPATFLSPRPDDSEGNPYGVINQDEYDRFPTQDQKDAMDGAASPDATNPFSTLDDVARKVFAQSTWSIEALVATDRFQLIGSYYIGTEAVDYTARRWFRVHDVSAGAVTDALESLNPDELGMLGAEIDIIQVRDSGDVAELTPSVSADADGFYTNPYIVLNDTLTTTLLVNGGVKTELQNASVEAFLNNGAMPAGTEGPGIVPAVHALTYARTLYNTARTPVTVTVTDGSTNTGGDYQGADSLMEAVKALGVSAGLGGIIYVKKGVYTWDEAVVTAAPIQIICEPSSASGIGVGVSVTNAAGFALSATRSISISGMSIEMAGASNDFLKLSISTAPSVLHHVTVADGTIELGVCTAEFFRVNVTAITGTTALHVTGDVNVKLSQCTFVGGPALEVDSSVIFNCSFDRCSFTGETDTQIIECGASGFYGSARFTDCVCVYPGSAIAQTIVAKVDFILALDSRLVIDGLNFNKAATITTAASAPYMRIKCAGNMCHAVLRNIVIEGAATGSYASMDLLDDSCLVMLSASAASAYGNTIEVDGIVFQNFRGQDVSGDHGVLGFQAYDRRTSIKISRCRIHRFTSIAAANTWIYGIRGYGGLGGNGNIVIEDPFIKLDVPWPSAGILSVYGILITDADASAYQITIRGGTIVDCYTIDVYCVPASGNVIMQGLTSLLTSLYNANNPGIRWTLSASTGSITVMNNIIVDTSTVASTEGLRVQGSGKCSVIGNSVTMNGAGISGIYIADGVAKSSIVGNTGIGVLSALNTGEHRGIGDVVAGAYNADYDTNSLSTTTLR